MEGGRTKAWGGEHVPSLTLLIGLNSFNLSTALFLSLLSSPSPSWLFSLHGLSPLNGLSAPEVCDNEEVQVEGNIRDTERTGGGFVRSMSSGFD